MARSSGNLQQKLSQINSRSRSRVREGKVSRNPFINFLAEFRATRKGVKMTELSKQAGREWRNMSKESKSPYLQMAQNAPKKKSAKWKSQRRSTRSTQKRSKRRRSGSKVRQAKQEPTRQERCKTAVDKPKD
ncbi:FACT complex subunit SSRP1 [Dendroctonus ponderosae]